MWIDRFVAGIIFTILIEAIIFVIWGISYAIKAEKTVENQNAEGIENPKE